MTIVSKNVYSNKLDEIVDRYYKTYQGTIKSYPVLNLKQLGTQFGYAPVVFQRNVSSKGKVKAWFFVTFNTITSYIFPGNFIEVRLVVPKLWKFSLSILTIFIKFLQLSGFFDIFLLQKN